MQEGGGGLYCAFGGGSAGDGVFADNGKPSGALHMRVPVGGNSYEGGARSFNAFGGHDPASERIKCVLVGDGAVGKTSLVVSYTTNGYPTEYTPTAFDNYSVVVTVDERPVRLQLCDTAGQDDFDSLRPLCYPGTDVFLVCFSVVSPTSFSNIRDKWMPELRRHGGGTPILLVGTQADLRTDVQLLISLAAQQERPVSPGAARRLAAAIGARGYVESSALTQRNLKEVFDEALLAAMEGREALRDRNVCGGGGEVWTQSQPCRTSKSRWKKLCCFT